MISFTLENVFILTVFQLLISGLILSSTGAVLHLQRDPFVRKILKLVTAAFCLYSAYFLIEAGLHYRNLSSPGVVALTPQWDSLAHAIETAAFLCLALSYLPQYLPERLGARFWALVAAGIVPFVAGPYVAQHYWVGGLGRSFFASLLNGAVLAGVAGMHLRRKGRKGLFSEAPLYTLAAAQFLRAAAQGPKNPEWLWMAEHTATLVGLGLFALVVDARSNNLQVRFFLRLNLIFVVMASLLILIVAETERREYLGFAESHAEELSEFLRGHLIYFHGRGMPPAEILSSPEIIRKITSDFGRLVDLRRVRLTFQGWHMEMSHREDWTVSHDVYPNGAYPLAPRLEEQARVATLTPVPVFYGGQFLGKIELDQGLQTINARIARQMRTIFLTFTVAVFVAAGLFGFTVRHANKTIQKQFEELEKTHAQLAHAARLASAGQLASGVAHEINNPAGIILTTADYLLREAQKESTSDAFQEDLQAIRRQARRISNIVSGLLTFSRHTPLNKQRIDLNSILQQSITLLTPRFREQQIQVEQHLQERASLIFADPDRLEQVFVNLLNNAADALPTGGTVRIESAACHADNRSCLMVSIADTGSGIPEEHLKSIFDPFFSTKTKGQGTGLGLSISYGIVRDHGGQIEVESKVGHGTVFRVHLPAGGASDEEL